MRYVLAMEQNMELISGQFLSRLKCQKYLVNETAIGIKQYSLRF